jgi:hypothetical protein
MASAFEPASFRDRHARIFRRDGRILRALSAEGLRDWDALATSAFFGRRVEAGDLVRSHRPADEASLLGALGGPWAGIVEHEAVPFVSYPYEWTFGMLRDAALLHLDLMQDALDHGLILKDASAYNIQFAAARPVFIDTASFTRFEAGEVWHAYRQFCQMFLFPLLLQAYKDVPFQPWLRGSLEGIEARDMRALLSLRDLVRPGVMAHVALQAGAQARFEDSSRDVRSTLKHAGFDVNLIKANVRRLRRVIARLEWTRHTSTWSDYQGTNTYSAADAAEKSAFVRTATTTAPRQWVWDLGANTGHFARVAAEHAAQVLAVDADALAVERLYRSLRRPANILPLIGSVTDPSPGLGWRGEERVPLARRGTPDLTLCLALIHHVVIAGNIPLAEFVDWIAGLGGDVVIEFVSKQDAMVRRLLLNKDDQYSDYEQAHFESTLATHFRIVARKPLQDGTRVLYHGVRRA